MQAVSDKLTALEHAGRHKSIHFLIKSQHAIKILHSKQYYNYNVACYNAISTRLQYAKHNIKISIQNVLCVLLGYIKSLQLKSCREILISANF